MIVIIGIFGMTIGTRDVFVVIGDGVVVALITSVTHVKRPAYCLHHLNGLLLWCCCCCVIVAIMLLL